MYKTNNHMINVLGSRYMVRIEQWRDEYGSWRVGLDWYNEDTFKFICEKDTLREALLCCYEWFLKNNN